MKIYCYTHHRLMQPVAVDWRISSQDQWVIPMFQCKEPECSRYFARNHGYFDMRDRQMDKSRGNVKHCPEHPGSLAIVDLAGTEEVWRCIECNTEENMP